ncbi:hypothetical protein CC1G_11061 [Coprinopsis cinerea okayama7|uniref:Required for respiratory growth protein 9, mitochondrial n=1 Tax=Coprinopsis cinerea (strain Okayama-7 / 130 / ATCC MYA-4618 / FGSC 9003) TaxID=240176 RepID=A8NC92_COPC7|nr:hypothetical protein CC1G_11061 [Coprinopsis cinerea okayama7\|eukprot:XP_001832436.1 hypothetical protein CC1G_11061 [Coprinopsis cinerea okayama7\
MASLLRSFVESRGICLRSRLSTLYAASNPRRFIGTSTSTTGGTAPKSLFDDDDTPIDLSEDEDLVNGARPGTPPLHARKPPSTSTPAEWRAHREAIKKRYPNGWAPTHKISREAMHSLRQLNKLDPEKFTTQVLAEKFSISPEAVRRILKSKWEPSKERKDKMVERERRIRKEKIMEKVEKEIMAAEPWLRPDLGEEGKKGKRPKRDRLTLT